MIIKDDIKHILISRTDNIGDAILTLPLAAILKQQMPEVKITFLARDYVRAVVENYSHVDTFLSWNELSAIDEATAITALVSEEIDCVIHAMPKKSIAKLMKKAGISYRIGTSRRLYHWLYCNERVNFSRKNSKLHEAQLNLKLLAPFDLKTEYELSEMKMMFKQKNQNGLPDQLVQYIDPQRFNLIVHPFTNGNAREWPIASFNALIQQLPQDQFHVIVTGSKKEKDAIQSRIATQCKNITNVAGLLSLSELAQLMAHCEGLVANSTGPLHMAASLGIHALGLFPVTKGMHPNRWAPIGSKAEFLMVDPNCDAPRCREKADCFCMESITVDQVKSSITSWLNHPPTFHQH